MHSIPLLAVVWAQSIIGGYGQVVRMNTEYTMVPVYGFTLLADISVDDQKMRALVDTGTSYLFFTWKQWYEAVTQPGACSQLVTGCVQSSAPQGPTTTLAYSEGTFVGIKGKTGKLTFGSTSAAPLRFGLVVSQQPSVDLIPPVNSVGLGRQPLADYPSLVKQLGSKLGSDTFALYLKTDPHTGRTVGEVLLGGGDPSLYVAPLRFVQLRSQQEYIVTLGTLQVGSGIKTIGINGAAIVDSGTQGLIVPGLYIGGLKNDILAQASAAAGTRVECTDIPGLDVCVFECTYRKFFPHLELGLNPNGDVPILINNLLYARDTAGLCTLGLKTALGYTWTLPDFVLVGRYFEFQPSQGRIGIAAVRSR